MKLTAVLLHYTHVLHNPKGHSVDKGFATGEISCRVRTYAHSDDQQPGDGEAIREESHTFKDEDLQKMAMERKATAWDEADLRSALAKKLKGEVK